MSAALKIGGFDEELARYAGGDDFSDEDESQLRLRTATQVWWQAIQARRAKLIGSLATAGYRAALASRGRVARQDKGRKCR